MAASELLARVPSAVRAVLVSSGSADGWKELETHAPRAPEDVLDLAGSSVRAARPALHQGRGPSGSYSTSCRPTSDCASASESDSLSVLCFNVFAGSPIPYYNSSSLSLEDSERLRAQICQIRKLNPAVICLQEICSDGVER
jgi:hypothetical protein